MDAFDREVQNLENELSNGDISGDEFDREMHELEREYRYAAEEAAQEAYDNEMQRW